MGATAGTCIRSVGWRKQCCGRSSAGCPFCYRCPVSVLISRKRRVPPVFGGTVHQPPFPLASFPGLGALEPFSTLFFQPQTRFWFLWRCFRGIILAFGAGCCVPPPSAVGTCGCCCDAGREISPAPLQTCKLVGCCGAKVGRGRIQALLYPCISAPGLAGGGPHGHRATLAAGGLGGGGVPVPLCSSWGGPVCSIPIAAPGCSRPPLASREEKKICWEKI